MTRARRLWTETEHFLMRELYPHMPTQDMAALLDRSAGQTYQHACVMRLQKSQAFHASQSSGRVKPGQQHPAMVATQFKRGSTPHNKGVQGWQSGGRSAQTHFKPGSLPHTTLPIGSYRVTKDGYLEQKYAERPGPPKMRWKAVPRLVWQAAHGPIPAKHIIAFKPGCATQVPEQITADKLVCMSMADNARRNHPIQNCPELAKLYQLKGAITRQLNRRIRQAQNTTNRTTP